MTRTSERISFVWRSWAVFGCVMRREDMGGRLSGDLDNLTYLDVGLDRSWGRKGPVHWRGS